jgi:hypothetical protein
MLFALGKFDDTHSFVEKWSVYKQFFGIFVTHALWMFEVFHNILLVWVKRIKTVWFTVSTVPLTFLRKTNFPLLENLPKEVLLITSTFKLFYFFKLITVQLEWGKCFLSLSAPIWFDAFAFHVPLLL